MRLIGPLWLASRSPRRLAMLESEGVDVRAMPSDLDDGELAPGSVPPSYWVAALAYLKARRVRDLLGDRAAGTIIGADTVCVHRGRIVGQARDAAAARAMLEAMRGETHVTITGVCMLEAAGAGFDWFVDGATVRIGDLDDAAIDGYVASGGWRGKAGAYNLSERVAAGWPITCEGDPATVMGLPLERLRAWLKGAMPRER